MSADQGSRRRAGPSPEAARRATGVLGEDHAAAHLTRLGMSILARNVRSREGEIDLIAFDATAIVFVEVKSARRASRTYSEPLERLSVRQRARLRRLAAAWLAQRPSGRPHAERIRFDAIGVLLDEAGRLVRLDHLEDAW